MNIKNIILVTTLVGSYLAYVLFYSKSIDICDIYCNQTLGQYHNVLLFFPFVLLFSLVTYKMPETAFTSWWRFTRIAAPVVLVLAFVINLELHHNPSGEMQNIFDAPALWALYIAFSIGSVVAIYRGYRRG